jgi:uncharacterized membrane protein
MQSGQAAAAAAPLSLLTRRAAVLFLPLAAIGIWAVLTPDGLLGKADAIGYAVCHRIDLRSFHLGVRALPLCARCTGMHLGAMLALLYLAARGRGRAGFYPTWPVLGSFALFALAFAVDGLNSYLHFFPAAPHLYAPSNVLRLITGLLLGISMGTVVYAGFNQTAWNDWRADPVMRSPLDLVALLALGGAVAAAVVTENPLVLYPLALVSALGVVILLSVVYSMIVLILQRRENQARSWGELVVPLAIGLTLTFVQIGLFDLGRYWLTGTWSGFTF